MEQKYFGLTKKQLYLTVAVTAIVWVVLVFIPSYF
ncbi:hypothetical protein ig2599ANME_1769 [groundwater metagenome]